MTIQPPDPLEPGPIQPASGSESKNDSQALIQRLVRLAGVILILIVVARGAIFLVGREPLASSTMPSGPRSEANAAPSASVALPGAVSTVNVDQLTSLATWGLGALRSAYYAPDGNQFALLTTVDLRIYDATTNQLLRSFPIDDFYAAVAIAPDWEKFVVCSGNTLKIYHLEDGQLLATLLGPPGRQTSPAFSPDGSLLASVAMPPGEEGYTGSIDLWRVSDGKLLGSQDAAAGALTFSPDGRLLASWYAMNGIRVWGLPDLDLIHHIDTSAANAVLFLPDSQTVVAAEMDGKIHRYRAMDGSPIDTAPTSLTGISSLRLSPDGLTLAALGGNGKSSLWRLPEWQPLNDLQIQTDSQGVFAFAPHHDQVLAASKGDVALWNLSDGQHTTRLSGFHPPVRRLAFLADGNALASLSEGGMDGAASLLVRSVSDGGLRCELQDTSALSLAASPTDQDGGRIALGTSDGSLFLLRASDCVELKTAKAYRQQVQDVSFAPVEPLLATSSMDTVQVIYYLEPFQIKGWINPGGGWVTPVRFNQRGDAIAAVSADGKINVWDYPMGRLLYTLDDGAEGYQASLAFTPDSARLVSGAHDRLRVWRASDGELVADWPAGGWVQGLATSSDGSLLAVGLANGQIQLRSLADGSLLRTLPAHSGPLSDLVISPGGRYLASAGQDGRVRLWGLSINH
jgi:WD40 repeat protein